MPQEKQKRFVIFAGSQQHARWGTRYISRDGTPTDLRSQAVWFYSAVAAQGFARLFSILDSAYVGQEEFTETELQGWIS